MQQQLVILGSTGSIGRQALDIVREHTGRFSVCALSCNRNWKTLAGQINEFKPKYALICDESSREDLEAAVDHDRTELLYGVDGIEELAVLEEADIVLNSLVGFAGFIPTVVALQAGKKVALANKETLVAGGAIIGNILQENGGQLVPIDSEHSAILQCLHGEEKETVEKLLITASGGPFRTWSRKEMKNVTVEDALNHPNWSMGDKITIDSATMMNKGLEIIEAHWLFDIPFSSIEAVIHPQSIIHSIVTFEDGSSKAQLGPPNMKVPILYALTYPNRLPLDVPRIEWDSSFELSFEPVDHDKFPCLGLAVEAGKRGGVAPAILNAANEIAVRRFLDGEISYIQISEIIEHCLNKLDSSAPVSVESLIHTDRAARELSLTI